MSNHLMNLYAKVPVAFEKGEGMWLYDAEGKQYLDALAGIAVTTLGHSHPAVVQAIQDQAGKVLHTSNIYDIPLQIALADKLCQLTGHDQAFFCNSGAEAAEAAIKLLRLHGHQKGFELPHVLVVQGGFHGRTMGAVSAAGGPKVKEGFEPLLPGFSIIPYNDIRAVHAAAKGHNHIAGILVEPIQGESGIHIPNGNYLNQLREICDEQGWLLALDEIQCGMGRTGTFLAHQENGIEADIVTMAKGLANGVPIGACLAKQKTAELFSVGKHGTTFGGNPLACRAALATLEAVEQQKLWENAAKQGKVLLEGLQGALGKHPHVKEIRGKGLMIGIEMDAPCRDIMKVGLEHGLLFTVSVQTTIRLLPPLIIEDEHVQMIVEKLPKIIDQFFSK